MLSNPRSGIVIWERCISSHECENKMENRSKAETANKQIVESKDECKRCFRLKQTSYRVHTIPLDVKLSEACEVFDATNQRVFLYSSGRQKSTLFHPVKCLYLFIVTCYIYHTLRIQSTGRWRNFMPNKFNMRWTAGLRHYRVGHQFNVLSGTRYHGEEGHLCVILRGIPTGLLR